MFSFDVKAEFWAAITPVLSVTQSFILICWFSPQEIYIL